MKKGATQKKDEKNINKQIIMNEYFTHQHYKRNRITPVCLSVARENEKKTTTRFWMWISINKHIPNCWRQTNFRLENGTHEFVATTAAFARYTIPQIHGYLFPFAFSFISISFDWCRSADVRMQSNNIKSVLIVKHQFLLFVYVFYFVFFLLLLLLQAPILRCARLQTQ